MLYDEAGTMGFLSTELVDLEALAILCAAQGQNAACTDFG